MSDDIKKALGEIQKTQTSQHLETTVSLTQVKDDLKYHIKRTDLLEKDLKPVKEAYTVAKGFAKIFAWSLGILSTLAGLVWVISKFL